MWALWLSCHSSPEINSAQPLFKSGYKQESSTIINRRKTRFIDLQLKRQGYCMHIPKRQGISGCYSAVTPTNARQIVKSVIYSRGIIFIPFAGMPLKNPVPVNRASAASESIHDCTSALMKAASQTRFRNRAKSNLDRPQHRVDRICHVTIYSTVLSGIFNKLGDEPDLKLTMIDQQLALWHHLSTMLAGTRAIIVK